jgi:hypothetical protein
MNKDINLEELLEKEEYRSKFKEFCSNIKCEENIIFWEMVQIYKMSPKSELKEAFDEIYEDFFKKESKYELNIDNKTRREIEEIKNNKMTWNKKVFDIILERVKNDMNDSFSHFTNSNEYKEMLGITEEEPKNILKKKKSKISLFNIFDETKNVEEKKETEIKVFDENNLETNKSNFEQKKSLKKIPSFKDIIKNIVGQNSNKTNENDIIHN